VFHVHLPALRDRKEDIPSISDTLVGELNRKHDCKVTELAPEVQAALYQRHWPGNVRELRNVLERAVILAGEGTIELRHLPAFLQNRPESVPGTTLAAAAAGSPAAVTSHAPPDPDAVRFAIGTTVEEAEKGLILRTLDHTRNNK